MLLVLHDAVVLIRISLLSEQDVIGLEGRTQEHRLLEVHVVVLCAVQQVERLVPQGIQPLEHAAPVVGGRVIVLEYSGRFSYSPKGGGIFPLTQTKRLFF